MRNSYKYTKMYSGAEPVFTEGDVFTVTIPLSESATATVGPTGQVADQVTGQDKSGSIEERRIRLVEFGTEPRSRKEMREFLGLSGKDNFKKNYLMPLLKAGKIEMTIPDKPNSRNQKYKKVI